MLKILWVSEVYPDPNSGAGGTELLMVQKLREAGHSVTTLWANDLERRLQHGNLHYAFELPNTYWKAIELACRKTSFDVVTVNLGQSYLACKKLKSLGFQGAFVVRSHGLDDHLDVVLSEWERHLQVQKRPLLKRLSGSFLNRILHSHMRQAAQCCDGYIVSNSLDAGWLQKKHGLAPDRIATIPQAPAAAFRQTPPLPMSDERLKRILYVANFHFAKGPQSVATAVTTLLSQNSTLQMTWICHSADHGKIRKLFRAEISDRIRFLGWMPQQELVNQFDQHGIFLYPSLFDGFGKVFLEAMSRGLCVVGTRAGGMVDLICDGQNGFLCDFNSADQMVDTVRQLLAAPDRANRISNAAALTARKHSWERVAMEMESFFQSRLVSVRSDQQMPEENSCLAASD
jgi:glycosyltransferase involved in cell wall biosynthesis